MCAFYAQRTLYFSLLDCLGVDDHSARLCSVVIFSHIFTLSPTFHSFMQRQFNEHARLAFFFSPLYTARQLLCDNVSIVPLKSSMKIISVGIHTCILFLVEKSLANINCLLDCLLVCPHFTDWSKKNVKINGTFLYKT